MPAPTKFSRVNVQKTTPSEELARIMNQMQSNIGAVIDPLAREYWNTTGEISATLQQNSIDYQNHTDGWVSIKDYGAIGDGIVDDAPAFQRAIDALKDQKVAAKTNVVNRGPSGILLVPSGCYRLATQVVVNTPVKMIGAGGCIWAGVDNDYCIKVQTTSSGGGHMFAADNLYFRYYGAFARTGQGGIFDVTDAYTINITNCTFEGLGMPVLKTIWLANINFAHNVILQHCDSDIIYIDNGGRFPSGDDIIYLGDFNNNFFQHAPHIMFQHYAINAAKPGWNLRITLNAFEGHKAGCILGDWRGSEIRNNFFEGGTIGILYDSTAFFHPQCAEDNYFVHGSSEWSSGTTYYMGYTAMYNGLRYYSLTNGNINKQPDINPSDWQHDKTIGISITSSNVSASGSFVRQFDLRRNTFNTIEVGIEVPFRAERINFDGCYFSKTTAGYVSQTISGSVGLWRQETPLDVDCVVLDSMQIPSEWTFEFDGLGSGSGYSLTAQSGCVWPKAIELYEPNVSDQVFYFKDYASAYDLTNYDYLCMPILFNTYVNIRGTQDSDPTIVFNTLTLGASGSNTNMYVARLKRYTSLLSPYFDDNNEKKWQMWCMPKWKFETTGTPNWNNIGRVRLNVYTRSTGGAGIRFGGLYAIRINDYGVQKIFDPQNYAAQSVADTSGATLVQLEASVNALKAALRRSGGIC